MQWPSYCFAKETGRALFTPQPSHPRLIVFAQGQLARFNLQAVCNNGHLVKPEGPCQVKPKHMVNSTSKTHTHTHTHTLTMIHTHTHTHTHTHFLHFPSFIKTTSPQQFCEHWQLQSHAFYKVQAVSGLCRQYWTVTGLKIITKIKAEKRLILTLLWPSLYQRRYSGCPR